MLVGRAEEVELLRVSLEHRPCSLVVFGEPGMGKTSLCEVVARKAGASVRIAWGRAWEFGGAPPFFPWLRVIRAVIEQAGDIGGGLAAVAARLESGSDHADARARLSLFEAVRRGLADASLGAPVLIVLDDVHAADASTLQLARYLQRELSEAAVALLMTAREVESNVAPEPARTLLADLARDATRTLRLSGLDETALSEWLPWFCGRQAPDGLAGKLKELTGGNPFLVRELVAAQRGDLEAIVEGRPELPRTGREVIQQQVAFLDGFTHEVLQIAAAQGRSADVAVVARVLGCSRGEVVAAREVAMAARLVTGQGEDSLRFTHSLISDALYAELTPARRREIHAAMVEALPSARISERARHALEAARLGAEHAEEAFSLCREAGARAHRSLAFEEATRHFADAIAVAPAAKACPLALADVHVAQGEAWLASGNKAEAARALELGATLAVPIDAPEVLARAAIGLAATREYVQRDIAKLELLELALVRLENAESELAARLMARLATDLAMQPDSKARRAELSARALTIARRTAAPATIALALEARLQAIYGADSVQERVKTGAEILALARVRGDVERELSGLAWQLSGLLEGGEVLAARALAADHARLAERQRMPGPRINAQSRLAMLAFLAGRFDEGFAHAGSARAIGLAAKDAGADLLFHAQLVVPCDLIGQHAPLEAALGTLAREGPRAIHGSAIKALYARALLALGRLDEARAELAALGARDFADIPDDFVRIGTLAALADTVVRLAEAALARPLERLLAPYATQNAMIGTAASLGAVSLYLGRLARLTGRHDEAISGLRSAREQNAAMQAWPWLAWSEFELAASLSPGDVERSSLLESARQRATDLGMPPLLESLARASEASRASESTALTPESLPQHALLRRQARGWSLSFEGRTLELGSSRGLSYVARLCESPGREIHALELASGPGAPQEGPMDALLDPRAKATLRARLRDLRAAIEDAERDGDLEHERRARQELDALQTSLSAALGLGGRSRKHGNTAERARIAVTVAIRRAIALLSRRAPALAAHLTRSIRTGLFCVYDPDPTSKMRVETAL